MGDLASAAAVPCGPTVPGNQGNGPTSRAVKTATDEMQRATCVHMCLGNFAAKKSGGFHLLFSIDWFKGKITGKSHRNHGKIYGFRLRFSHESRQPIDFSILFSGPHVCRSNGVSFTRCHQMPPGHTGMAQPVPGSHLGGKRFTSWRYAVQSLGKEWNHHGNMMGNHVYT